MTPVDVRDAAARLCDEAQGRWMTLVPGETTTRGIRHERGNEASALAAAIRALPVDDAAERAARGAAWELAELRATVEVLRGRVEAAEARLRVVVAQGMVTGEGR